MKRGAVCFVLSALVAGCSSMPDMLQGEKIQYKGAGRRPTLDVPPDLTSPSRDNRYDMPDVGTQGSATLSAYNVERAGAARAGSTDILPNVAKVRIERSGNERWLVVPEAAEKVWPVVKEFWQDMSFLVKVEQPEIGVMETDWAESRAGVADGPIRNLLGRFLDMAHSSGERDKYRTRLERGAEPGTTEIYISHRGMVEVVINQTRFGDSTINWQHRPADIGLEAEFLRRLMLRFGVDNVRAKAQLAGSESKTERARLVRGGTDSSALELSESFDRAWRRVGLVLDRVGFAVEDRDRSKGFYFVRYVDPKIDAQKEPDKGFLSSLAFWKSDNIAIKPAQYRVAVKEAGGVSEVQVQTKDGQLENSETSRRILSLLLEQLK